MPRELQGVGLRGAGGGGSSGGRRALSTLTEAESQGRGGANTEGVANA